MDGWKNRCMDGWIDGWMDGQTDGWKNRPSPPGLKGKRDECMKGPEIRCHGVAIIGFE
jgi:hypothetical protein